MASNYDSDNDSNNSLDEDDTLRGLANDFLNSFSTDELCELGRASLFLTEICHWISVKNEFGGDWGTPICLMN